MENINVKIEILSCVYDELNEQDKALVDLAKQATANIPTSESEQQ